MGDIAWLRALDGAMVIFTGFRATGHPTAWLASTVADIDNRRAGVV
jgi:hypothetical protein